MPWPGPGGALALVCARGGPHLRRRHPAGGSRPAVRLLAVLDPHGLRAGPGRASRGHRQPGPARGTGPTAAHPGARRLAARPGGSHGGAGPRGRGGHRAARTARPGSGRVRGDGAAGLPGVVVPSPGVARADGARDGHGPPARGGRRHGAGLLLVRPVVGATRTGTAGTTTERRRVDAVGPLCGGRAALPGPHRCRDVQAVTNE